MQGQNCLMDPRAHQVSMHMPENVRTEMNCARTTGPDIACDELEDNLRESCAGKA